MRRKAKRTTKEMLFHKYKDCENCGLCQVRRQVVIGRGTIPATVLFMGEAPGKTEDLRGEAFVGRAGKLLDKMMIDAAKLIGIMPEKTPSFYIINTVLCHPSDSFAGPNRVPSQEEILACMPNIIDIYKEVRPELVIFLGKVAEQYYSKEFLLTASIQHPAFLLRQMVYYPQNVRKLAEAFVSIFERRI